MSYQPPPDSSQHRPSGAPPPPPSFGTNVYSTGMAVSQYGETNSTATAAMWFAIGGFLCGPLSLVAFILGISGLNKANRLGGLGRGKSIFAIVVGAIWTMVLILLVVALMSADTSTSYY